MQVFKNLLVHFQTFFTGKYLIDGAYSSIIEVILLRLHPPLNASYNSIKHINLPPMTASTFKSYQEFQRTYYKA